MASTEDDPKARLLAAAVDHLARHGAADATLRGLAAAVGTSHRMLSYHFGSREGLFTEVVRALEERERQAAEDFRRELGADTPPPEIARRVWQRLADPRRWAQERLFFELYGQALQGRAGTSRLLDGIVDAWLDPMTEWLTAAGVDQRTARAQARLGLAVFRGLLLDLLATGDRIGVDEAMEAFIGLFPD